MEKTVLRRTAFAVMSAVLILALSSCGKEPTPNAAVPSPQASVTAAESPTDAAFESRKTEELPAWSEIATQSGTAAWSDGTVKKAEPEEFVPRTFSGNAIVRPESTADIRVSADSPDIGETAIRACAAISNESDRNACEDTLRQARATQFADPKECAFIHDPKARAACYPDATTRMAQKDREAHECDALTDSWAKQSCYISVVMGNPLRNPTGEECALIQSTAARKACENKSLSFGKKQSSVR